MLAKEEHRLGIDVCDDVPILLGNRADGADPVVSCRVHQVLTASGPLEQAPAVLRHRHVTLNGDAAGLGHLVQAVPAARRADHRRARVHEPLRRGPPDAG